MGKDFSATSLQALLDLEIRKYTLAELARMLKGRAVHGHIAASLLLFEVRRLAADPVTPLEAAALLASLGYTAPQTAEALKKEYWLDCFDLAVILRDAKVYPSIVEHDLAEALQAAGFQEEEARTTARCLYPVQATVQANLRWQDSGYTVLAGHPAAVACTSGSWTANPETGMCDAGGNPRYLAKPGYTLPGQPEGALIGRLGSIVFMVGRSAVTPARGEGKLEFCINDDLNGRYGRGLSDNVGAVVARISLAGV